MKGCPEPVVEAPKDYAGYFEPLWQEAVETTGVLCIPPGFYHSSKPIYFKAKYDNESSYRPLHIMATGAVFDNTVVFGNTGIVADCMQVRNSPSHGFVYLRGQGAHHRRHHAEGCKGHGHYFGCKGFFANSQVASSQFDVLSAIDNDLDGFHFDGYGEVFRSWFNRNIMNLPITRGNRRGFSSRLDVGPTGLTSRMNYNCFVCAGSEVNEDIAEFANANQTANTFICPHFVEKNEEGVSLELNRLNYIFGGRIPGDITNKQANTIFANTAVDGEQARFSYNPGSDLN